MQHRLAVEIGVSPRRINEIAHGKPRVSADTALRLARFFGATDGFWLNLQTRYDLEVEKDQVVGSSLDAIRAPEVSMTSRPSRSGCPLLALAAATAATLSTVCAEHGMTLNRDG